MSDESEQTLVIPRQLPISTWRDNEGYVVIGQETDSMDHPHPEILVHPSNLAGLILALRRLDGQEV